MIKNAEKEFQRLKERLATLEQVVYPKDSTPPDIPGILGLLRHIVRRAKIHLPDLQELRAISDMTPLPIALRRWFGRERLSLGPAEYTEFLRQMPALRLGDLHHTELEKLRTPTTWTKAQPTLEEILTQQTKQFHTMVNELMNQSAKEARSTLGSSSFKKSNHQRHADRRKRKS